MSHVAGSAIAYQDLQKRSIPTGFGPYLLSASLPWLLLAMTFRTLAVTQPLLVSFIFFYGAHFIFLMAFLVASERMIDVAGGATKLGRLSLAERWRLSFAVVWQMVAIGLVVSFIAVRFGMDAKRAARFVQGFDGIAFNRFFGLLLVWSPLTAVLAFLMLVEKGMGRPATVLGALRALRSCWLEMLFACMVLTPCIYVLNLIQGQTGPIFGLLVHNILPDRVVNLAVILFLFAFSFARLWITVAVLTYALRRSYRSAPRAPA